MKNILFSHEGDIDGLGCVVLSWVSFGDSIFYVLLHDVKELELTFREYIESGVLEQYDNIFVTDLALYDPALTMVANSSLKEKVHVFDHHQKSIDDLMNRYSFTKIIEKDPKGKRCATSLFYDYLVENHFICKTQALDEFVELTRLEDTWEWKMVYQGEKAHDLAILFNCLGKEKYITKMTTKLLNDSSKFTFDQEELNLIQMKKKEYNQFLESIMSTAEYFLDENNNKFGIVFANYEYRNELAEYIVKMNNPEEIKYLVIVAMDSGTFGQKSYRTIESGFDVNAVATLHGGGGHPSAAAVNITEEQKNKSLVLSKREALKYLADCKY